VETTGTAGADGRTIAELTVVIPTVGRRTLADVVDSIAAGTAWPGRVVVVDQSDGDDVAAWAASLRRRRIAVDVVRAPRRGVAGARNRGIEEVRTRWFAIDDDDQTVAVDWLERMHRRLVAHHGAVITGKVAPGGPRVPSSTTDTTPTVHQRPLLRRDPLFAGNMATSREVFARIGPFDERPPLNGAEDNDWGYRALRGGVPIVYAPEVVVTHLDWRDDAGIAATYRRYARAQGAFYGKYLRRGDRFIALRAARDVARGPWLLLRAAITRDRPLAELGWAEVAGILPGIVAGARMSG
jgi:GT2 family glycosyltransferase